MTTTRLKTERIQGLIDELWDEYLIHKSSEGEEGYFAVQCEECMSALRELKTYRAEELKAPAPYLIAPPAWGFTDDVIATAKRLVGRYMMNKGTDSEFIACVTPSRSTIGKGEVWDDWRALDAAISSVASLKPVYQLKDWNWYDTTRELYEEAIARGDEGRILLQQAKDN